jgi:hypothetical protein
MRLRKPDDWRRLERIGFICQLFRPRYGRALLRLSRRWRRLDNIEWVCT